MPHDWDDVILLFQVSSFHFLGVRADIDIGTGVSNGIPTIRGERES